MSATCDHLRLDKHSESIAKIDHDIHDLEKRIRHLRAARNKLIPVSDLPTEILTRIFGLVQVLENGGMTTAKILPITWVSQHWRDVAIACPQLWCHIDQSSLKWFRESLKRCRNSNVSVKITVPMIQDEIALKELFDESFSRLTSLKCLSDDFDPVDVHWSRPLPFSWNEPAPPLLESLTLGMYKIPDDIFSGATPQLRRLVLNGSELTVGTLSRFTGLTHLSITNPFPKMLLPQLLGVLSFMPHLEAILLSFLFDIHPGVVSPDFPSPQLPNLTSLQLVEYEHHDGILRLLHHIEIPDTVSLRIHVAADEFSSSDMSAIFDAVNRRLPPTRPIHAIAMDFHAPHFTNFHFYHSPSWNPVEGCVKIEIEIDSANGPQIADLMTPLNTLALGSVQTLYLDSSIPIPPISDIWDAVFSPLHNVEEVRIQNSFATAFIGYLTHSSELQQGKVFPSMQKLVLGPLRPKLPSTTSSMLDDVISLRRKSGLKEVIAQKGLGGWEPANIAAFDVVLAPMKPPCELGNLEDYLMYDSEGSDA
ncbi:hypothetical protein BDN72DRAFT_846298 [Pluteus cervinus]|uniref:Uncharacterized protein n=1 Tax=Pluteus cervinus TaxID=181527 RepID=A0ACD3AGA4_9AGAR|nr:hypothetical protein BDN72DRAFT_846298 [Pluteus cervinus]